MIGRLSSHNFLLAAQALLAFAWHCQHSSMMLFIELEENS